MLNDRHDAPLTMNSVVAVMRAGNSPSGKNWRNRFAISATAQGASAALVRLAAHPQASFHTRWAKHGVASWRVGSLQMRSVLSWIRAARP